MSFQIINPTVDIALIALGLAIISMILQIKFLDWKNTRRLQKSIQEKNKKALELLKKGDEHSKKEADELNKQVMQDMQKQFKNMPKQLIVSMIVFVPAFAVIRALYVDAGYLVQLPFDIPILGAKWGWLKWYIVSGFIFAMLINFIVGKLEEKEKI